MNMKILKIEQPQDQYYSRIYYEFIHNEEKHSGVADFSFTAPQDDFLKNHQIMNSNQEEIPASSFPAWLIEKLNNFAFDYIQKENEFINYHRTGDIPSSTYNDYLINYDISNYPKIISTFEDKKGEIIEFRKTGEKLKYVKKKDNQIVRNKYGDALYLSDEEMAEKGLHTEDTCIVAFNSNGESVALASDEFGADGIWVNENYKARGIGLAILELFRSQFSDSRKMGQMTDAGRQLARAYFRRKNL